MKLFRSNPNKSKAQAIVEFSIVLPILLLLLYGLIETGRLLFIYSSVINASRQAARYGSTSGVGPNGVPRYQDCAGIREAAQNGDFLDAFDDSDITITYDTGPGTSDTIFSPCNGTVDTGVSPSPGDRVTVAIDADFNALVPLVPFISRTVANGNPIIGASSRTLLLSISIAPLKETTTTLITAHVPDPSQVGQPVNVTVTVTGASTTPTGTVDITGADTNCSITLAGGTGSCSIIFSSVGTKTITASYAGDADHDISSDSESHSVILADTITVITADTPDPSLVGGTVVVGVDVTSAWGPPPAGTVNITGADTNCSITLSSGTGTCNVNFTSTGAKTLTATYSGDAEHAASSDTENHSVVAPGVTVTTITADSPDPSQTGQSVTVSVAVTSTTTPTGTVTISGADTNCSITLSGGTGSCSVVFSSVGAKTITATYGGDASHTGSSDTESHSVALPATVTTITADSPDPSLTGQTASITVTVTGGTTTPTGTVTISGADTNCSVTLAGGTGSCNVTFSSTGTKTLTASYGGDSSHAGSNDTETHTVTATAVVGCDSTNIILDVIRTTGSTMDMAITNNLTSALTLQNVTVDWYYVKGHQTGGDKTLRLQSAQLGTTIFWTGNNSSGLITLTPVSTTYLPASATTTLSFTFHQSHDNFESGDSMSINFSTPGCEGANPFTQTTTVK